MRPLALLLAAALGTAALTPARGAEPAPAVQAAPAQPAPPTAEQRRAETKAAYAAAMEAGTRGPASVTLLDQASLQIPSGMIFIPQAQAARLLRAFGNQPGANLVGVVLPTTHDEWLTEIRYTRDGYVRDDEAKDFDAAAILKDLQDGTLAGNADRAARGFQPIEVSGWVEPPAYDAATHRLIWAAAVRTIGAPDEQPDVNYNTRLLGRDGYFSLNLIADEAHIAADKPLAEQLLRGLQYRDDKRYESFVSGTDRVAEYGLGALLGVVVLKKIGLIALAGAFFLKFAKLIILAVVGFGAAARRIFRKKATT